LCIDLCSFGAEVRSDKCAVCAVGFLGL